jgi:hypothetical protein
VLVAGVEFGDGISIALGVEEFHGAFGEVAAVSLWRIAARASASSEWRARAFRSRRRRGHWEGTCWRHSDPAGDAAEVVGPIERVAVGSWA